MSQLHPIKTQKGVALLFTMIFLGLMVATGLLTVQFAGFQQKMATNFRSSQGVFIAAETALKEAEQCIKTQTVCSEITNYDAGCTGGLCFNGSDKFSIPSCRTATSEAWQDGAIWRDTTQTRVVTMLAGTDTSARYIIEFICYVPRTLFGVTPNPSNPADWARLYRITALASAVNQNSQVMLQSTYKR